MASPLYGVAAMNAIGFGVYGNVIRRLNNPDSITSITAAGIAAGGVQVRPLKCKIWLCVQVVAYRITIYT